MTKNIFKHLCRQALQNYPAVTVGRHRMQSWRDRVSRDIKTKLVLDSFIFLELGSARAPVHAMLVVTVALYCWRCLQWRPCEPSVSSDWRLGLNNKLLLKRKQEYNRTGSDLQKHEIKLSAVNVVRSLGTSYKDSKIDS